MTNGNGNGTASNGSNGNGSKANRAAVIGANTLVPLGAVFLVFMAAWKVQAFMEDKFKAMQKQLDEIKHEATESSYTVNNQLDGLKNMMVNRWTSQDMKIWEQELKIRNPSLDVPNSSDVTRNRSVTGPSR